MPAAPIVTAATKLTLDASHAVICFQAIGGAQVDAEAGIIRGVSVMSKGPALGHPLEIDDTSLDQVVASGKARERVPLMIHHGSGLTDHVGDLVNFTRDGDKARADAELYDSHPLRSYVLEKARKNPKSFGLSAEFYPGPKDAAHPLKEAGGKIRLARCHDLDAVAFVRQPATNSSLFSQEPETTETSIESMTADEIKTLFTESLAPVLTELASLKAENTGIKIALATIPTEEQRKTELEAAGTKAVTAFAATCGIKPGAVPVITTEGTHTKPDDGKTEFQRLVEGQVKAGAKNPWAAARYENGAAFNQHMALERGNR